MMSSLIPMSSAIGVYIVIAIIACMYCLPAEAKAAPPTSIKMRIFNHAGAPIDLYWINTFQKSEVPGELNLVQQTEGAIRNASDFSINSYNTHEFLVRFSNHKKGVEARFKKGPREERITVYYSKEKGMYVKQVTKLEELVDTVRDAAKSCNKNDDDEFSACVGGAVIKDVQDVVDSKSQLIKYRNLMSDKLRNYTCSDTELETSEALSSYTIDLSGESYTVNSLLDSSHAKIWVVNDLLGDDECNVLMNHARPRLQRATTARQDGTSEISESRKAWQAGYKFSSAKPEDDKLYSLYKRVVDITNKHTGYNLGLDGQDGLTVIKYNPADQYKPHCDGDCDGAAFNSGGRVATAVMYCKVADVGGATTFTKADVFVKPERNSATFFSYKGPDGRMDEGYTEHSGCPVIEGEKWIATFWMREGVSKENPGSLYDPTGIKMMSDDGDGNEEL
jgi:hypothetical protein